MVDHVRLKTVLDNGEPFADDDAALTYMNTSVTVHRGITYQDLIAWAADGARMRKVAEAALTVQADYSVFPHTDNSGLIQSRKSDALVLWALLSSGADIELDKASLRAIFNNLDNGEVISNADRDALFALSDEAMSRWDAGRHDDGPELGGFGGMDDASKLAHIAIARAL